MRIATTILAALLIASPALAGPRVITSVMPVHGIVAAVMGETGEPELLLEGQMPEHRSSFTPSQIAALGKADLVFIVGQGLEAKLAQLSGSETVNGKTFIALSEAPGVKTLAIRQGGGWKAHDHEEEDQNHEEEAGVLTFDPHVWLDPENAKAMATAAATALGEADPANAALYSANARAYAGKLDALAAKIAADLDSLRATPFIVFHDAFQYFEARFGLTGVGSIADVSARAPSAERIKEVRDKLEAAGVVCVFREPQYDSRLVDVVLEGTKAKAGVLDPLGAGLAPGPHSYEQLLLSLAAGLKDCLAG